MEEGKRFQTFKAVIKWLSLAAFLCCVTVIFVESAIPGEESANQSNDVAGLIQNGIDSDYDKENLKDIEGFDVLPERTEGLFVGDVITYEVHYHPEETSYPSLDWTISAPDSVKVDYGKKTIECLKEGMVSFDIRSQKHPELTDSFVLDIEAVPVESIELPYKTIEMEINESLTLQPIVRPENATHKEVTYRSDHAEIVSVSENGILNALAEGTATITVASKDNPEVTASLSVTITNPNKRPVSALHLNSLSLYAKGQKATLTGSYGPTGSTFSLSNLTLSSSDAHLKIENLRLSASSASFSASVRYDIDVEETIAIPIQANYRSEEKDITAEATIEILPREEVTLELIDSTKWKDRYEGVLYQLTYYGNQARNVSRNITIDIPLVSEVTSHPERYKTENFRFEVPSSLKIVSQSYNRLVVAPNDLEQAFQGKILYSPNGTDNHEISFAYNIEQDDSHIIGIVMKNLYVDGEEGRNIVYFGKEYGTLFDHSLSTMGGQAAFVFDDTGLDYEILDGMDVAEFVKQGENVLGIKTKKEGTIHLRAISRYEKEIGLSSPTKVDFTIAVVRHPTSSYLLSEGERVDSTKEFVLKKNGQATFEFLFQFQPTLKENLPSLDLQASYDVEVEDESILSYSDSSQTLTALKGGTSMVTFTPEDEGWKDLSVTLKVRVDHVEVDLSRFAFHIEVEEYPDNNAPSEDFDKVALGTEFSLNATVNEDATIAEVGYLSSDDEILYVNDETGYVKALKIGKATLTSYSKDDPEKRIEKTIEVVPVSSPFTLDTEGLGAMETKEVKDDETYGSYVDISLRYGKSYSLSFKLDRHATSTKIDFAFLDPTGKKSPGDILSVDAQGKISLLSTGTTWLQVTYGRDTLSPQVQYYRITSVRDTAYTFQELAKILRKLLGHLLLFCFTTMFLMHFIALAFPDLKRRLIGSGITLVVGFAVAGFSELIQVYTPGRGPMWRDVGIDFAGVAIAVVFFLILFLILFFVRKWRAKKKEREDIGKTESKENDIQP